jgi:hypothetical protein
MFKNHVWVNVANFKVAKALNLKFKWLFLIKALKAFSFINLKF